MSHSKPNQHIDHHSDTSDQQRSDESAARIRSYREFWPYYLDEHRDPKCRYTHFVGTTGFVLYLGYLISEELSLGMVLLISLFIGWVGARYEGKGNAFWALFGMIGITCWAEPMVLYGVLFAYFWAWVGHFLIEHNRPATFQYPLWSLASDFKMWGEMCLGRRWTGDAPTDSERHLAEQSQVARRTP